MIPDWIIYFTFPISLFGVFHLIRDILKGKTKPNLVTWFLWALAPLIGSFLQLKAGAGLSSLPVFLAGFFPVIIFILALLKHNAYWKITTFDIFCGIFSLVALLLWLMTHNAALSIIFAILSDALASIPTLIKSWKFPETETALGYLPGIINNILGLLLIRSWEFSIYSFGVYFIILNTTLILFIERKRIFQTQATS
jgi:hypothetical protein